MKMMFPGIPLSGSSPCDNNTSRLLPEYGKLAQNVTLPTSTSNVRTQMSKSRDIIQTVSNPDIIPNISLRGTMSTPYMTQFPPNLGLPSASSTSSTSLPSTMIQYPTALYPFQSVASNELKQLTLTHYHNLNSSPVFPTDLSKMKSPFINRNYLELAMLVCNTFRGKLFPCPHCRYVTDRRNNLKRHVSTMHQACDKVLECCGVNFTTKASLREHIMIFHHNGYSCAFCGRRFCRKALLKRHLSVHSGQKDYSCPHCDYATSHKSNLERHKRIHDRLRGEDEEEENSQSYIDVEQINDHGIDEELRDDLSPKPLSLTVKDTYAEKDKFVAHDDTEESDLHI